MKELICEIIGHKIRRQGWSIRKGGEPFNTSYFCERCKCYLGSDSEFERYEKIEQLIKTQKKD